MDDIKTYQDFEQATDKLAFVNAALNEYRGSAAYLDAVEAVAYDRGENTTIMSVRKFLYNTGGAKYEDIWAANNKIATNIFPALITQQNEYSLGNGIKIVDRDGNERIDLYDALPQAFDSCVKQIGRKALLGGAAYGYYDGETLYCFAATEFCPLYDENTNQLRAGIRFYQIAANKPLNVWIYEQDGVSHYRKPESKDWEVVEEKRPYRLKVKSTAADGVVEAIGENFGDLPIAVLKANEYSQSELSRVQDKIDAYDLTLSGLANDIDENEYVYWIIKNAGGMEDADIARFKQALKTSRAASISTEDGSDVEHFEKDVPTAARTVMLDKLEAEIYKSFCAVNMQLLPAGAANEMQITAIFTQQDNKASEYESHIREFVMKIAKLAGLDIAEENIVFERQKLQNDTERAQVEQIRVATKAAEIQAIVMADSYLDEATKTERILEILGIDKSVDEVLRAAELDTNTLDNDQEL